MDPVKQFKVGELISGCGITTRVIGHGSADQSLLVRVIEATGFLAEKRAPAPGVPGLRFEVGQVFTLDYRGLAPSGSGGQFHFWVPVDRPGQQLPWVHLALTSDGRKEWVYD